MPIHESHPNYKILTFSILVYMYFIWIKLLKQYQITSQLLRKTLKDIPSRSWYFDECHNDAPL